MVAEGLMRVVRSARKAIAISKVYGVCFAAAVFAARAS